VLLGIGDDAFGSSALLLLLLLLMLLVLLLLLVLFVLLVLWLLLFDRYCCFRVIGVVAFGQLMLLFCAPYRCYSCRS
jgi:hypothetical protein